jgi:chromosome segregation ATPase
MFEANDRSAKAKTRSITLGNLEGLVSPRSLADVSGTVYGELKLSDRLMTELTAAKTALQQLEGHLAEALQHKSAAETELAHKSCKLKEVQNELELLRHQFDAAKQVSDLWDLKKSLANTQLQEIRGIYFNCEEDRQRLNSKLHDERAMNDKFKNKATELEHRNSLLQMENDVIGERLKGLYDAFDRVIGQASFSEKIRQEFQAASLANAALSKFSLIVEQGLSKTSSDHDRLRDEFEETMKLRNEMKTERDKLFARLKKEGLEWELKHKKVEEEINKLTEDNANLEKRQKMMGEEQEKTKLKLKQIRSKRRQYGESEEKTCKNCSRSFYENENFNWSCRIHLSQFGGELWWCCGKTGQNAPGCRLSKHGCKEDDDEANPNKQIEDMKTSHIRCSVTLN